MVFPCSRIFYLCLESLGLDITSVIFNRFKKWQQHPLFCDFLIERNHTNTRFRHNTLLIERVLPIPTNFLFFFDWNLFESDPFDFDIENILTKFVSTYWLLLTLDPCPWEMNKFLLELHHVLFTLQPNKKEDSSRTEQRMSSQEPIHS